MIASKSICAHVCALLTISAPLGQALADAGHGPQIGQPGNPSAATRTIEVILHDNYFEPEAIVIEQGETVRFVIVNQGAFLHEFNIGTAEMHAEHQAEMMAMFEHGMIEVDGVNHDMMQMDMGNGGMAHDDPNSVLLEPGQSTELTWTFSTSGDLEFACNVPGHYQVGMVGVVDVQS